MNETDSSVSIILYAATFCNCLLLTSIILRHHLYFNWMHAKKFITGYDTLGNTGEWKNLALELILNVIMPYPFINDYVYYETYTHTGIDYLIEFRVNWILLCIMTYIRLYQVIRCFLLLTYWLEPRA